MKNFLKHFINKGGIFLFCAIVCTVLFVLLWSHHATLAVITVACVLPLLYLWSWYVSYTIESIKRNPSLPDAFSNSGFVMVVAAIFVMCVGFSNNHFWIIYLTLSVVLFCLDLLIISKRNKRMIRLWEAKKAEEEKQIAIELESKKKMLDTVLFIFLDSGAPNMNALQIREILQSKENIDKIASVDNPEELSVLLNETFSTIPVSNIYLLFSIVAQKLADLRGCSLEEVCKSRTLHV